MLTEQWANEAILDNLYGPEPNCDPMITCW